MVIKKIINCVNVSGIILNRKFRLNILTILNKFPKNPDTYYPCTRLTALLYQKYGKSKRLSPIRKTASPDLSHNHVIPPHYNPIYSSCWPECGHILLLNLPQPYQTHADQYQQESNGHRLHSPSYLQDDPPYR